MRTCTIPGCDAEFVARGWCARHYYTWKRTGDVRGLRVTCLRCGDERFNDGRGRPFRLCDSCRTGYAICCQCEQILPLGNFAKDRGKANVRCRPCDAQFRRSNPPAVKPHYKKSTEQIRRSNLKRLYGMSLEEYEKRVVEQEGRCAICVEPAEKLVVDHCHRKGSVRKLLCGGCNTGLGMFQDDPERMAKAIAYLTDHS